MKNKLSVLTRCCLFAVLAVLILSTVGVGAENDTADEIQDIIGGIIAYTCGGDVQGWIDGELASNAGVLSEWYVLALRQYNGGYDFTSYVNKLEEYISENSVLSAATRQKYALVLTFCGRKSLEYVSDTPDETVGKQGIMSLIFGLHLQNNGVVSEEYGERGIIDTILNLRLSDGGWALNGDNSDVDVTAMTVQALAPHYGENGVAEAVEGALAFLGAKQLDGGDFKSYGTENPESTAQVITALTSLGIDPTKDERFVKNGVTLIDGILKYRLPDGSFCHTLGGGTNQTATTQAFYSLVSVWRQRSGLGPLYVLDEEQQEPAPVTETSGVNDETSSAAESEHSFLPGGVKVWICIGIFFAAAVFCLIIRIKGKKSFKNYIFVLAVGAVLTAFVIFIDIQPADSYYSGETKENAIGKVFITIRCDTVIGKTGNEYIPQDGVILPVSELEICEGDSVYDVLVAAAKKYGIKIDNKGSSIGAQRFAYISGINYLYEYDFGDLSGWVYHVNGEAPSVGCGEYILSDGDRIEWLYTCDLGRDVGN